MLVAASAVGVTDDPTDDPTVEAEVGDTWARRRQSTYIQVHEKDNTKKGHKLFLYTSKRG